MFGGDWGKSQMFVGGVRCEFVGGVRPKRNLGELEVLLWFMNIVTLVCMYCALEYEYDYVKTTITLTDLRVLKGAC